MYTHFLLTVLLAINHVPHHPVCRLCVFFTWEYDSSRRHLHALYSLVEWGTGSWMYSYATVLLRHCCSQVLRGTYVYDYTLLALRITLHGGTSMLYGLYHESKSIPSSTAI
jgi:hypothetical protein